MGDPLCRPPEPTHQRGRGSLKAQFVDTSIILGYLDDHPECVKQHSTHEWITTHAHLLEVYSVLRSRPEVEDPADVLHALLPLAVAIPHGAIQPAAEMRRKLRAQGKDCSYIDALGYGVAQAMDLPMLIGDDSFEGVSGVLRIPLETKARPRK